jgi:hypothetical protein
VDLTYLEALLGDETRHLEPGVKHYHIVVATDDENEWDLARFTSSPPYRERDLADQEAHDPRLLAKVPKSFSVEVLECRRACPRSALGRFGWNHDDTEAVRWWDLTSWKIR